MKNVYVVKANNDIVGIFDNFKKAEQKAIKVLYRNDNLDDISVLTVPLSDNLLENSKGNIYNKNGKLVFKE